MEPGDNEYNNILKNKPQQSISIQTLMADLFPRDLLTLADSLRHCLVIGS